MTHTEIITSSFVMGLAGSIHCIGMCGPLALSLPVAHNSSLSRIAGGVIYNSGRIITYTLLGILTGLLGDSLIHTSWQSKLSMATGMIILLYLFVPKKVFQFSGNNIFSQPFILLRQQLGKLFHSQKTASLFFIGILNGLLPCGLVYLALSSSVIMASAVHGGMFMFFFGAGTFPVMLATVIAGNYLNQSLRLKLTKAVPVLLFIMAVLLILRGLNLGIPFISPEMNHQPGGISCH
jgi:sulfite exporter TauE/SafE